MSQLDYTPGAYPGLGSNSFLADEDRDKTAAYLLGAGVMGILAGFGIGAKGTNKLMLLVGTGALFYGNHLSNLVEFNATPGVQRSIEDVRNRIPDLPSLPWGEGERPRASFTFS